MSVYASSTEFEYPEAPIVFTVALWLSGSEIVRGEPPDAGRTSRSGYVLLEISRKQCMFMCYSLHQLYLRTWDFEVYTQLQRNPEKWDIRHPTSSN